MMIERYGLLGYPLEHTFSPTYFAQKFKDLQRKEAVYELFPLPSLEALPLLWRKEPTLRGLNVTIPYKEKVGAYCQRLDPLARRIGAVNVLKKEKDGHWAGYNSDYEGFRRVVLALPSARWRSQRALILGTGGAAKAVFHVLSDLGLSVDMLSRTAQAALPRTMSYDALLAQPQRLARYGLIVNATPLGMYPQGHTRPLLPYDALQPHQNLVDLVYNPSLTAFMKEGQARGCFVQNGYKMLTAQADRAWEIWNDRERQGTIENGRTIENDRAR